MSEDQGIHLSPDVKFHLVRKIECHKIMGLSGQRLLPHESKYIEFHRPAGIILFERNIESAPQVRDLISEVDEKLSNEGERALVMADHEGDFVSELRSLIGVPPSAMAIAASGDPAFAREVALETGRAMRKIGVNVVLAPVADCYLEPSCSVTGIRTFGRDPERVGEFVAQTIRGYRDAGILACAKHFPGHGSTRDDSHVTLPRVTKTLAELARTDLVPFKRAVEAGVDMMMTAHVAVSAGQAGEAIPASFDRRLIQDVLRGDLGFDGVVITDALEMEGARSHVRARYGGLAGGFERAVVAGADLLLYASPVPERIVTQREGEPMIAVDVIQTIIDTLERVVDRSRIDRKLEEAAKQNEGVRNLLRILDDSEKRIQALRRRAAGRPAEKRTKTNGKVISLKDYASAPTVYKTAAERSMTLLRDPSAFIPVGGDRRCVLVPVECYQTASLKRQDVASFAETLCRSFRGWEVLAPLVGFEHDEHGDIRPVFEAPQRAVIDVTRYDPRTHRGESSFEVKQGQLVVPILSARGAPPEGFLDHLGAFADEVGSPFVIVTGWPFVEWIPASAGCLLTFGASPQTAAAAAAVLSGRQKPPGSLDLVV
jgi:beta-glucosidase-like glycosyl hydrolase